MLKKDVESLKTGDLLHIESPYNGYSDHKICHSLALVIARPANNGEKLGDYFTLQSLSPYNDWGMSRSEHFMPKKSLEDFCHGTVNHLITQEQLDRLFSVSKCSERADIFNAMVDTNENGLADSLSVLIGYRKNDIDVMPNEEDDLISDSKKHKIDRPDIG